MTSNVPTDPAYAEGLLVLHPLLHSPAGAGGERALRDRRGHVLLVDARELGRMVDRTHRELTDEEICRIDRTYHAWRGGPDAGEYEDIPGFCKSATLEEIREHGHVLTPGRYVGAERRRTMASRLRRRCGASLPSCASSRPRPPSSMPLSLRIFRG